MSRSSGVHGAHDLSDRFGYTWLAAWSRVQLGTLDVAGGQPAGARRATGEALDLSLAIHINRNMALCLVAFARLAFAAGDPELAALLAGAAPGLRQQARRRAWPVLRQAVDEAEHALELVAVVDWWHQRVRIMLLTASEGKLGTIASHMDRLSYS